MSFCIVFLAEKERFEHTREALQIKAFSDFRRDFDEINNRIKIVSRGILYGFRLLAF